MLKNYQKYIDDLRKIDKEKENLRVKEIELNNQESNIQFQLLTEAHEYVTSKLEEKLKPFTYSNKLYYMLNDEVGVQLIKITEWSHCIDCRVVYYKKDYNKNNIKQGKATFSWWHKGKKTIDEFIDEVISGLEKIYATRENAMLSRVAKKYNM